MKKDFLQISLVILFGGIGAAIPITGFYLLWSWAMGQVSMTLAYAGVIKVGITLVMLLIGGSATIVLAMLGGVLAIALAAAFILK